MDIFLLHRTSGFACAGITCDVSTAFLVSCSRSAISSLASAPFNLLPPSVFHPSLSPFGVVPRTPYLPPIMSLADFIEKNVPLALPHHITHYVAGQTPISTNKAVATALVSYLAIIFGIQELMKTRQPLKLNALFQLHNVILTLGSGLLLACMAEEVIPIIWRTGLFNSACSPKSWTPVRTLYPPPAFPLSSRTVTSGLTSVIAEMKLLAHEMPCFSTRGIQRLEFYYIINYYFKYLELLDTVFLVLKKKPLGQSDSLALDADPAAISADCARARSRQFCSFPSRIPPRCHCFPVFHPTQRSHQYRTFALVATFRTRVEV